MSDGDGIWLRMRRVLPATRAEVWTALTDPAVVARWWGPKGFTVPELDFEPQPGERLRIAMQPPEGERFHLHGEFREVRAPSRLAYTFAWDPPDTDDRETLVTLSLEERADGTEVALTQGAFTTEERLALHDGGWSESFEKLEQLLG
jgi:uncharacterized protein YndB with AHSA1/START domain